jgi:hypothetical protein
MPFNMRLRMNPIALNTFLISSEYKGIITNLIQPRG